MLWLNQNQERQVLRDRVWKWVQATVLGVEVHRARVLAVGRSGSREEGPVVLRVVEAELKDFQQVVELEEQPVLSAGLQELRVVLMNLKVVLDRAWFYLRP